MNTTAFVTIVSNNYLHFARTLLQSVALQHPDADRFCVIVDRDPAPSEALTDEFTVLPLSDLQLPDGDDFFYQYNVLELNTAVKPWALACLLRRGYQQVLYIDPDICLYRPLTDVFAMLASGSDLVLTPHLLAPITDTLAPGELDIRRAGTYNLGFCALRGGDNMRAILKWWQGKLRRDCIIAHDRGIFVDQSWMDLVPGMFPRVGVLRHPGYNMAYWNIAQRPATFDNIQKGEQQTLARPASKPKITLNTNASQPAPDLLSSGEALPLLSVAGYPLVFFHFSGLNPLAPHSVSKHQNRYTLDSIGAPLTALVHDYCQRVVANGIQHYRRLPYGFGSYDDGVPIADAERSRFRTRDDLRALMLGKPFASRHLLSLQQPSPTVSSNEASGPADPILRVIYRYFLGREPDASARASFAIHCVAPGTKRRLAYHVGKSAEARAKPGWLQRLVLWPFLHPEQLATLQDQWAAQLPGQSPELSGGDIIIGQPVARPSPYGGLHALESDSAKHGLWVGPQLDLPICGMTAGHISLSGSVDLQLLAKAPASIGTPVGDFKLHIHGPHGLLHTETITQSGDFNFRITVPAHAMAAGSQWTILASRHVVPKSAGLNEDTRQLSWRVRRISVDELTLVDSARSPTTLGIEALVPPGGINLIGYLTAELGLGEAARSLARACVAADIPFSALDVGFQSNNLQRDTAVLAQAASGHFAIDMLYVNADQAGPITAHLQTQAYPRGRYRIGYWHWEQPELPASALGAFAHIDEVWVPSTFVHDAVAPYSPVPVVKIPHAIAFAPSAGAQRSAFGLPNGKLLALVMYDFHSYQHRKNPQAALAAYRQAAAQRSDVALVIKTINGQHHSTQRQKLQESVADLPHIIFIDEFFTRQQTWDLQACCDILLSLHRAEGFGLAPAEMMYLGKPVIATGWSANTDFMTADNSFPVRFELQPLQQAVGVYPAGQMWAEADVDHAAWCLTRLLDDASLRHQIGARAAQDIQRQLSPQAIGALVRRRLSLLGMWHPLLRG